MDFPRWIRPEIIIGLPFRWYGLMYVLAFATTYIVFSAEAKRRWGIIDKDLVLSFFSWSVLGLLIGARLFGTLVYDPTGYYAAKPWLVFWPFDDSMRFVGFQGMSYHGGVVGLVVALAIFAKRRRIEIVEWADVLALSAPLGYTFGRLGNFINGELYGRATASPLGMLFPEAERLPLSDPRVAAIAQAVGAAPDSASGMVNLPRFPSQLYEAFFEGLLLWAILRIFMRKKAKTKGIALGAYPIGYGAIRFIIEYFREPDIGMDFPLAWGDPTSPGYLLTTAFNFTTGQLFCAGMVVAGAILILARRRIEKTKRSEAVQDVRSA